MRTSENSWLQGTLIVKNSPPNLHTYTETKLHPRANKFQTYHTNSAAKQEHNPEHKRQAAQSHAKPIDTPKLNTGHFIALQREEI